MNFVVVSFLTGVAAGIVGGINQWSYPKTLLFSVSLYLASLLLYKLL